MLNPRLLVTLLAPLALHAAPSIQAVVNSANFQPQISSAAWVAIQGSNLTTTTRTWGNSDFNGNNLPTKLGDVSVTINGVPAYVYYISPSQVNVLAPDDPTTGSVMVVLSNSTGASLPVPVKKQAAAPALFAYSQLGSQFAIAQQGLDSGLIGPPMLLGKAVPTHVASPGETVVLYGTGFGPSASAQPTGQIVAAPSATANPVTVTIGGQQATVQYAALIGSGLYQLNVVVPAVLNGDAHIVITVNNVQSTGSVSLPIQAFGDPSGQNAPSLAGCLSGAVSSVTFSVPEFTYGQADAATIGGTQICADCNVKPPLYPQFAARLETALERGQSVKACYDSNGLIYQVQLSRP